MQAITANGVQRNLSIMGGEPLCADNVFLTTMVVLKARELYPDIKIYVWTGYIYEDLIIQPEPKIKTVLDNIDYLIDGPFILEQRDTSLPMRGSCNQRILDMKELRKDEKEKY